MLIKVCVACIIMYCHSVKYSHSHNGGMYCIRLLRSPGNIGCFILPWLLHMPSTWYTLFIGYHSSVFTLVQIEAKTDS